VHEYGATGCEQEQDVGFFLCLVGWWWLGVGVAGKVRERGARGSGCCSAARLLACLLAHTFMCTDGTHQQ